MAKFPANIWIELRPTPHLMPRAQGAVRAVNYYGCLTFRSTTGEVLVLDGFDGEFDGARIGFTGIYSNSLYGFDPVTGVFKQYDILRWLRAEADWEEHPTNRGHPTPLPRHVYGCLVHAPATDSVYLFRGAAGFGGGGGEAGRRHPLWYFWAYSFKDARWRIVEKDPNRLPTLQGTSGAENQMCHLADEQGPGSLYLFLSEQSGPAWRFDLKSETWSRASSTTIPFMLWRSSVCADEKRRRILFFGGHYGYGKAPTTPEESVTLWSFTPQTGKWRSLDVVGDKPAGPRANPGICYLPAIDQFLVYGGTGHYDQWLFDPATNRWTELKSISPPTANLRSPTTTQWCYLVHDPRRSLVVLQRLNGEDPEWLGLRLVSDELPEVRTRSGTR
jgi:hypothetical protein